MSGIEIVSRRAFLRVGLRAYSGLVLLGAWLIGCSRPTPDVPVPEVFGDNNGAGKGRKKAYRERLIEEISDRTPDTVTFDPVLISLFASFVLGLIKQCLLQNVLTQHRAVSRRPTGAVAKRLHDRISASFLEKHPDAPPAAVEAHCTATLESFRQATTEDIVRLYQEQKDAPADPSDGMWDAATVRALSAVAAE